MVHFVLNEKVDERKYSSVERPGKVFTVLHSCGVLGTHGDHTECPRDGGDQVRDHEDVVPVMVIRRGDVRPSAAS